MAFDYDRGSKNGYFTENNILYFRVRVRVRVRVTLRLVVYRQSVRLDAKSLEVHDHHLGMWPDLLRYHCSVGAAGRGVTAGQTAIFCSAPFQFILRMKDAVLEDRVFLLKRTRRLGPTFNPIASSLV
jgi:hypothetical protein